MSFVLTLLSACLLSALMTFAARRYALKRHILDHPDEARRSHTQPTPRGGGISIALVMLLALTALALCSPAWRWPGALSALGLALIAGIGWRDDHQHVAVLWRLAVHTLAAALIAAAILHAGGTWMTACLAFISAVVLINIWNFMDGIDGIATTQAVIAAIGYALLDAPGAMLGWVLAAALAGFLPFNFPKARIFLGDVGSGSIGYALALLIALNLLHPPVQPELLILPVSVFWVDASLTLLRRMARGEPWWQAHVQHAYQRWAKGCGSHVTVTLAYTVTSMIATALMFRQNGVTRPLLLMWLLCLGLLWVRVQRRYRHRREIS